MFDVAVRAWPAATIASVSSAGEPVSAYGMVSLASTAIEAGVIVNSRKQAGAVQLSAAWRVDLSASFASSPKENTSPVIVRPILTTVAST